MERAALAAEQLSVRSIRIPEGTWLLTNSGQVQTLVCFGTITSGQVLSFVSFTSPRQ